MSIKLYNGFIYPCDGLKGLLGWQERLREARRVLSREAAEFYAATWERQADERSPAEADEVCAQAALLGRRHVHPLARDVSVSWSVHDGDVFVILYAGRPMHGRALQLLDIRDYHYQNQVDPPDCDDPSEWKRREQRWGDLLLHRGRRWAAAPADVMHRFDLAPEMPDLGPMWRRISWPQLREEL